MAERKVINKYFPPDFDPSKIPRLRRAKGDKPPQTKVRLMSPFAMRCATCGQWIGKGTKFNARKETTSERFHSIEIFRFYIRCQRCAGEITYRTDPENNDYKVEKGAQRNFEAWREHKEQEEEREREMKEEEEENDPIRRLEKRTEESRREMEVMDALDEIRMRNARDERVVGVSEEALAEIREEEERRKREEEDAEDAREARRALGLVDDGGARIIKRLRDEDEAAADIADRAKREKTVLPPVAVAKESAGQQTRLARVLAGVKSVPARALKTEDEREIDPATDSPPTLASMLGGYASSDSDSDSV
ncbi:Pre-mRNA-splicing factor cwf16 [Coemansia sp. RSA 2603]|nr:Pre-mRNA-splicing factor cwf16 [Coemansia sp. RSA 2603]